MSRPEPKSAFMRAMVNRSASPKGARAPVCGETKPRRSARSCAEARRGAPSAASAAAPPLRTSRRPIIESGGPRIEGGQLRVDVHPHRLCLGVLAHDLESHLAPVPRVAGAAEG